VNITRTAKHSQTRNNQQRAWEGTSPQEQAASGTITLVHIGQSKSRGIMMLSKAQIMTTVDTIATKRLFNNEKWLSSYGRKLVTA
jgi:hypothetical protein